MLKWLVPLHKETTVPVPGLSYPQKKTLYGTYLQLKMFIFKWFQLFEVS